MTRVVIILVFIIVLALIGACFYLAFGSFPIQSQQVERVVPNDRFAK